MDFFIAVALLCASFGDLLDHQEKRLKCQKYYMNCVGKDHLIEIKKRNKKKMRECILNRKIK